MAPRFMSDDRASTQFLNLIFDLPERSDPIFFLLIMGEHKLILL